jgi:hypothetical protein
MCAPTTGGGGLRNGGEGGRLNATPAERATAKCENGIAATSSRHAQGARGCCCLLQTQRKTDGALGTPAFRSPLSRK